MLSLLSHYSKPLIASVLSPLALYGIAKFHFFSFLFPFTRGESLAKMRRLRIADDSLPIGELISLTQTLSLSRDIPFSMVTTCLIPHQHSVVLLSSQTVVHRETRDTHSNRVLLASASLVSVVDTPLDLNLQFSFLTYLFLINLQLIFEFILLFATSLTILSTFSHRTKYDSTIEKRLLSIIEDVFAPFASCLWFHLVIVAKSCTATRYTAAKTTTQQHDNTTMTFST